MPVHAEVSRIGDLWKPREDHTKETSRGFQAAIRPELISDFLQPVLKGDGAAVFFEWSNPIHLVLVKLMVAFDQ